jgi:hypothetical protein
MATKTVTIDTGEWVYVDISGKRHTVKNAETFTFELTDTSASKVTYVPIAGQSVELSDGGRIYLDADPAFSQLILKDTYDGVSTNDIGRWTFADPDTGWKNTFNVTATTINNVDAPTTWSGTFEKVANPIHKFTWSAVTVS